MTPKKRILPIFVPHLGCPYQCVFCDQHTITGADYTATKENVSHMLENAFANSLKTELEVAFYGGSFTAIPLEVQRELLEAVRPYRETGNVSGIRCSTRPDAISQEVLSLLKEYGVTTIELGCQSMDPDVLDLSGRGHNPEDVVSAAKQIHNAGIDLIVQMMTGLPGSTEEKEIDTARKLIALEPDGVRIYPTVIVRGTKLYDMWMAGEYKEHTVEQAVQAGSRLIPMFRDAGIPVIRFGLNPTEDLSSGEAVGGAYHPALGELVYSCIMLQNARRALKDIPRDQNVILKVGKGLTSKMAGQRRENINILQKEFSPASIKIVEDKSISNDSISVEFIAK